MITLLISMLVTGLVLGGLGRLLLPGPNPMGLGRTILAGLGGSITGGILGRICRSVFHVRAGLIWLLSLVLAIVVAAALVHLLQRPRPEPTT